MHDKVTSYIKAKYGTDAEHPWPREPGDEVFRHADNGKWFGVIMDITRDKLGLPGKDHVDILNVKLDDRLLIDLLVREEGYFRAWHMSKEHWLTILLDGTVPLDDICCRIDDSYAATASAKKKQELRPPKEWIVPANPKYYDIEHAFDTAGVIEWKQGRGIRKGDTVFMYVAAPVSAILYKCDVTETDIPCCFRGDVIMDKLMRIKLRRRYARELFTFERLGREYGIFAVRGPRGIPRSLSAALKE